MSVYTALAFEEVALFLQRYEGLTLQAMQPTTTGISNSNFFVQALDEQGSLLSLVLTVFESVAERDLPYFAALLEHLQQAGLPVPAPCHDRVGQSVQRLRDKACMLVPRLNGAHLQTPNTEQCTAVARALACIHGSSDRFMHKRTSDFSVTWRERSYQQVSQGLSLADRALLHEQLERWHWRELQGPPLPRGITHGDLFHDNALFEGNRLTGLIDFYYACDDVFIYDLAILINDWCNQENGALDETRLEAVLQGYEEIRPLSTAERQALPEYLTFAALRFWLSRLVNAQDPAKAGVPQKAPEAMKALMLRRMAI